LHINAAVFLLKSPIGVEPPEIASALADGPLFAIRMAGVLYLSNLSADGMRIHLAGFYLAPVGYILCIEYRSGKPLLIQAQKKPVIISLMGDQMGGSDVRLVKFRAAIVVLHDWQELR
jgi:hypothetical protein